MLASKWRCRNSVCVLDNFSEASDRGIDETINVKAIREATRGESFSVCIPAAPPLGWV